jgi:predicted transcriptional regulator
MISIIDILSALSDDKALNLFNTIALTKSYDSKTLIKNMGITEKQYYHRLLRLSKAGLVKRENGKYTTKYTTTTLGNIVCEAFSMVNRGLKYYFVLKAIEVLQTSAATDSTEDKSVLVTKLIDSLIDDNFVLIICHESSLY